MSAPLAASQSTSPPGAGAAAGAASSSSSSSGQTTRDAFNSALRSRNTQNNYIAHLKIWEQVDSSEGGGASVAAAAGLQRKARYLILAVQRDTGKVTVNKAKRNGNGTFSVGKDWDLNTLRAVEVAAPTEFTLTLSRSYSWSTDRAREQTLFLSSLVNVYRRYTRDAQGPTCIGFTVAASVSGASGSSIAKEPVAQQQQQEPSNNLASSAPSSGHSIPIPSQSTLDPNQAPLTSRQLQSSPPKTQSETRRNGIPPGEAALAAEPIQRSRSAAPDFERLPAAVPETRHQQQVSNDDRSMHLQGASLLSPVTRRPTLMRNDSAVPRLETTSSSPAVPTLASSPSSTVVPAAPVVSSSSSKDKLSERLARAAAGASGGRVTPTRSISETNTREAIQTAVPARSPRRQDSGSSNLSTPSMNARARLSSIEPVSARGGKAYERMLLAGTGLKSIGDEDEEQQANESITDGVDDAYGGVVPERSKLSAPEMSPTKSRSSQRHEPEADEDDDMTLVNVEEMLEGIDFRTAHKDPSRLGVGALGLGGSGIGGGGAYSAASSAVIRSAKGQGTADVIEASLLSELEALDSANIHSILNRDDRLTSVLDHVDAALAQLDSIDSLVASFKLSLNSRAEDIGFIESQNRGLQVMNANWRALQREIEQLSQTVNVPQHEVDSLLAVDYDVLGAIDEKEGAAASLYKAILQAKTSQMEENERNVGMAATTERLGEYSSISNAFASKMLQHLSGLFIQLARSLVSDPSRKAMLQPPAPRLTTHDMIEAALGSYCGLLLYIKEVEPKTFERIAAAYLTSAGERYKEECARFVGAWRLQLRRVGDEEDAMTLFAAAAAAEPTTGLGRSVTVRKLAQPGSSKKGRQAASEGDTDGAQAFHNVLTNILPVVIHESLFLSDFLHLNSNGLTFADYMDIETYFRRRAADLYSEDTKERRGGLREMKGAMELVFGFLAGDMESFSDEINKRDRVAIVGIMAALDAALQEAPSSNEYLQRMLVKLHTKSNAALDRFFAEQIKAVHTSASKAHGSLSATSSGFRGKSRGRGGLIQPVRVLPHFIQRVELQLANASHLGIRGVVDAFYSRLETAVMDSLLSLKIDTASAAQDEDKGAMNHQVLLIENSHHLVQGASKLLSRAPVVGNLVARAEKMYEDSLNHYIHFVLRRPLAKMMDFGDGIDSLRSTTPAAEVSLHSAYSKQSFRKLVKEYTSKDVRKQVDALWRRVLKHFDEDENEGFTLTNRPSATGDTLVSGPAAEEDERRRVVTKVWRRCEQDFVREFERMARIQAECYKGAGATLEVQTGEVARLFVR